MTRSNALTAAAVLIGLAGTVAAQVPRSDGPTATRERGSSHGLRVLDIRSVAVRDAPHHGERIEDTLHNEAYPGGLHRATGPVELTEDAAYAAAVTRARDDLRAVLAQRGQSLLERRKPFWLPAFAADWTFDRWLAAFELGSATRVVERRLEETEHESYRSYRAHLVVQRDDRAVERALRDLATRIAVDSERFAAKAGGTVGLWVILWMSCLWLEGLLRGYRIRRYLGRLMFGIGIVLPGALFVLI